MTKHRKASFAAHAEEREKQGRSLQNIITLKEKILRHAHYTGVKDFVQALSCNQCHLAELFIIVAHHVSFALVDV